LQRGFRVTLACGSSLLVVDEIGYLSYERIKPGWLLGHP
jgi:hypothetical protein